MSIQSDRKIQCEDVQNEWMNQTIEIVKNQLEDGKEEYEAQFFYKNGYYMLSGTIKEEEFIEIVKNINYF